MSTDGFGWDPAILGNALKQLAPRWFVMRDVHTPWGPVLMNTRPTASWMRGPMTRSELKRVVAEVAARDTTLRLSIGDHR